MTPLVLELDVTESCPSFWGVSAEALICSIRQNRSESSWRSLGGPLGPHHHAVTLTFPPNAQLVWLRLHLIHKPQYFVHYTIHDTEPEPGKEP